ncbi:KRSC protein, partial [Thinocorus orbignyianus]|nr:KRSC protein [Thinocorus orbignyianus]
MSCYDLCSTSACGVYRPQPIADSCNEPCVRQCPDSTTIIQPPPVVVTHPGPILSNFPQDAVVGSAGAPVLGGYGGYGYGGLWGHGGYGSSLGYGGLWGYGGSLGYGGLYGYGRGYASSNCNPFSYWSSRYNRGICGPC